MPILPDVLKPDLKVVFCGTAAGKRSALVGAYYAKPGNQFWDVLHKVGLTPYRLRPQEYERVVEWKLGLTDLCKDHCGMDSGLTASDLGQAALCEKVKACSPRILAFTGKRAGRIALGRHVEYGMQQESIGHTLIYVLPSTSGAARGYWDISHWTRLAEHVRKL